MLNKVKSAKSTLAPPALSLKVSWSHRARASLASWIEVCAELFCYGGDAATVFGWLQQQRCQHDRGAAILSFLNLATSGNVALRL